MAKFVSVLGKWYPAKEQASMKNTFGKTIESEFVVGPTGSHVVKEGEQFIYTGPNRAAVKVLKELGEETLGKDFRKDQQFMQAFRALGFNNADEYLKYLGFNEKETIEKQMSMIDLLSTNDKKKQKEILEIAGGRDFTGNKENDVIGGFGDQRLRKPEELTKSAK